MKKITLKPHGKDNNFSRFGTGLSIQDGVLSAQGGAQSLFVSGRWDPDQLIFHCQKTFNEIKTAFINGTIVVWDVTDYSTMKRYCGPIGSYTEDDMGESPVIKLAIGTGIILSDDMFNA